MPVNNLLDALKRLGALEAAFRSALREVDWAAARGGRTQAEVAEAAGVHQSTISKWECGRTKALSFATTVRIMEAYLWKG